MQKLLKKINKKTNKHKKYLLFIFLTAGLYFIRIFSKIIFFKPEGLYASHPNVWSDWALHITLTNTFANKPPSEWFLYHPYFSGGKLTYPFLTNLISGLLVKLGLNITSAMIWPSIILILLLLTGTYFLYYQLFKSSRKATLGIFIFLTSSGVGFFKFIKELYLNPKISSIIFPPIDYTRIIKYEWYAGNIPVAMLIPQRSFLIGITIGVWSLLLFLKAIKSKNSISKQRKLFIISGILAGILPIAHMHSFIALIVITGLICLVNIKNFKKLLFFVIPAGIISTFLFFTFISGGIQKKDFMTISLGWTAKDGLLSWIKMWWEVWGVMIPIAIYQVLKIRQINKFKVETYFFYGFFALFIIANIVVFQPTAWDNTKIFAWVYLGFSLLASSTIINLWKQSLSKKLVAILLLILLSFTGVLELIRLQNFNKNTLLLSKANDIIFAKYVRDNTKTNDIFLTASNHNYPLQMWGSRSIVLGYRGWVGNFGFDINQRYIDVRNIYQYPAKSINLIKSYDIDYIVVGDLEKNEFVIDQNYFETHFPIAFKNQTTIIYKIKY